MTQLTEDDYAVDMAALLAAVGVDPNTVAANSARLEFVDGKAVLIYTAMRAVPPSLLAAGLLRSVHAKPQAEPVAEEVENPTPIKRTAKKAVAKS